MFFSTSLPGVSGERYPHGALPIVARLLLSILRVYENWPTRVNCEKLGLRVKLKLTYLSCPERHGPNLHR